MKVASLIMSNNGPCYEPYESLVLDLGEILPAAEEGFHWIVVDTDQPLDQAQIILVTEALISLKQERKARWLIRTHVLPLLEEMHRRLSAEIGCFQYRSVEPCADLLDRTEEITDVVAANGQREVLIDKLRDLEQALEALRHDITMIAVQELTFEMVTPEFEREHFFYGVCLGCNHHGGHSCGGHLIETLRLATYPTAVRCPDCQAVIDRYEQMRRSKNLVYA